MRARGRPFRYVGPIGPALDLGRPRTHPSRRVRRGGDLRAGGWSSLHPESDCTGRAHRGRTAAIDWSCCNSRSSLVPNRRSSPEERRLNRCTWGRLKLPVGPRARSHASPSATWPPQFRPNRFLERFERQRLIGPVKPGRTRRNQQSIHKSLPTPVPIPSRRHQNRKRTGHELAGGHEPQKGSSR